MMICFIVLHHRCLILRGHGIPYSLFCARISPLRQRKPYQKSRQSTEFIPDMNPAPPTPSRITSHPSPVKSRPISEPLSTASCSPLSVRFRLYPLWVPVWVTPPTPNRINAKTKPSKSQRFQGFLLACGEGI